MTRGEEFRKTIAEALVLSDSDPVWLGLLDETVRALDLLERLEENVREEPLLVPGSTGQQRANPLLAEVRQQRLAVARLFAQLGVGEEETQSQRQARYARRRWTR
jgi:hypothetical protein